MQGVSRSVDVKVWVRVLTFLSILGLVTACDSRQNEYVEPPLPKVTVAKPLQQEVTVYLEFTGTTSAFEEVKVRARVAGFLQSMKFTPGTMVEATIMSLLFTPVFYVVMQRLGGFRKKKEGKGQNIEDAAPERALPDGTS